MIICSVQDAVILLTLFKYLSALIVSLLHKTSIDGSIFTCTTCIVYQYFKELVAFVLKAGAKIRTFSDNFQTFFKVFCFYFLWPSSYSRMSIIRLCLSSKAGAKVDKLSITSKYI